MQAALSTTAMGPPIGKRKPQRAMWLAFSLALLIHIILVFAPAKQQVGQPETRPSSIEIQVQYENSQAVVETLPEPPVAPEAVITPPPQPAEEIPPTIAAPPANLPSPVPAQEPDQTIATNDRLENPKTAEQLSRTILSSQFITEPSVADKIFGPGIPDTSKAVVKEFHFPHKPNMITMLDKPNPDLPFEYTEGLVNFAYDPGVKGDLQRFWDKITPEFGWRTNYGTEVKCVWVLVIAACGWGRTKE